MKLDAILTATQANETCYHLNCHMGETERGEFQMVAIVRLIMASLSIIGALSIVGSAIYRKTVCNPKVHPIFVLSIVDTLLSILWISGAVIWLTGGLSGDDQQRVQCFNITCLTVILQCVGMNITLIYALLAYSSIKQRDYSGINMMQQRQESVHVWPPLCTFTAYFIAWTLPIPLIMVPFGVMAEEYQLVERANNCSCWCLPYYGNIIPRTQIIDTKSVHVGLMYLLHLRHFITFYSTVLVVNFTTVFFSMAVVYFKVFRRIKYMMLIQENENTPLYGATRAMILAGQKDAKKRVFLFFSIYFITGMATFAFGAANIYVLNFQKSLYENFHFDKTVTVAVLLLEAFLVPSQGFLNALAYGWTRADFLSVMSRKRYNRPRPDSLATSYEEMEEEEEVEETEVESDREEEMEGRGGRGGGGAQHSLLLPTGRGYDPMRREKRKGWNNTLTPVSPGGLLGDV